MNTKLIALLSLPALLLACGGADGGPDLTAAQSQSRAGTTNPPASSTSNDATTPAAAPVDARQLLQAVQRSQLLLIATHATFRSHRTGTEISTMLEEHRSIYELLLDGDLDSACRMLETHLHRSMHPNIEMIARLGQMPKAARLPYLNPVERASG